MSATETIIAFATQQAANNAFGGPAKIVTALHKAHFVILARVLDESRRDADMQASLAEIRKGLNEMTKAGKQILSAIPSEPAPPSSDLSFLTDRTKAAAFQRRVDDYRKGVQSITAVLTDYVTKARECLLKTGQQIKQVESNLNMKGAKWAAVRQISNSARRTEIQFILVQDIPALQKQVGNAESLLRVYKNH